MEEQNQVLVETSIPVRIDETRLDEHGLTSIWDIARTSVEASDVPSTLQPELAIRAFASRLLNFLCKLRYEYAIVSQHDVEYLEDLAERDPKLFGDWTELNERVDLIAGAIHVEPKHILKTLIREGFDSANKYPVRKASRTTWFKDDWRVG
jgi:hypothetical protein